MIRANVELKKICIPSFSTIQGVNAKGFYLLTQSIALRTLFWFHPSNWSMRVAEMLQNQLYLWAFNFVNFPIKDTQKTSLTCKLVDLIVNRCTFYKHFDFMYLAL